MLSLFMAVMIVTTKLRSISISVIVISITPIPRTITTYRKCVFSNLHYIISENACQASIKAYHDHNNIFHTLI